MRAGIQPRALCWTRPSIEDEHSYPICLMVTGLSTGTSCTVSFLLSSLLYKTSEKTQVQCVFLDLMCHNPCHSSWARKTGEARASLGGHSPSRHQLTLDLPSQRLLKAGALLGPVLQVGKKAAPRNEPHLNENHLQHGPAITRTWEAPLFTSVLCV